MTLSLTPTLKPKPFILLKVSTPTLFMLNEKKIDDLHNFNLTHNKSFTFEEKKNDEDDEDEDIKLCQNLKTNKELLDNLNQLKQDLSLDRINKTKSDLIWDSDEEEEIYNNQKMLNNVGNNVYLPIFNSMSDLNKFFEDEIQKEKQD